MQSAIRPGKNKFLRIYYFIIFFGLFLTLAASVFFIIRPLKNLEPEIFASNKIIAPYYRPEVFKKSEQLKRLPAAGFATSSSPSIKSKTINLPILMYHYIEKEVPQESLIRKKLTISPQIFENQLKSLNAAGYEYYFASVAPAIIAGKIKPARPAVILTFDDGYADFYSVGLPFLKKYKAKATVYVIANAIGGKVYLSGAEIKELIASGLVEIGSHTLDHVALKERTELEQRRQIEESKIILEKKFNIKINTFAYPYGSFSAKTADLVRAAGYGSAVSVIAGRRQAAENLFYLSRLRPGDRIGKQLIDFLGR